MELDSNAPETLRARNRGISEGWTITLVIADVFAGDRATILYANRFTRNARSAKLPENRGKSGRMEFEALEIGNLSKLLSLHLFNNDM